MLKKSITIYILLISIPVFVLQSCLKDDVSPVLNYELESNALLLDYMEVNGDYINSPEMPSIISVDELYNNINNYHIIDIRPPDEYSFGHIPGAVNISNDSLTGYINSLNSYNSSKKIVLVSSSGQASAYYTCLLRLRGFNNIYSLNFGMAQWNKSFAGTWLNNIKDSRYLIYFKGGMPYLPDPSNKLPGISFAKQKGTITDKINYRIDGLIHEGFINNLTYVNLDTTGTMKFNGEEISNFYIVCYGQSALYYVYGKVSHLPGSHPYLIGEDLKSTTKLQTLPINQKIVVYSVSGQISAFVTAYLRLLGYDAKSLLYGANQFFHSTLINYPEIFTDYVFIPADIRNYSFVTGSSPK